MEQSRGRDWHAVVTAVDLGEGSGMGAIDKVLADILQREGWPEYTEHPKDRGGPTKGGITLATLSSWRRRPASKNDLKALTKNEALTIYRRRYVETNGIQKIPDPELQAQVIDDSVMSGPFLAVKDLQRAVDTDVDGLIGPNTLDAIQATGYRESSNSLARVRSLRLAEFVKSHPDQMVFLIGWLRRTLGFVR